MNIETLATFFGWCTVINIGLLIFGGLSWILLKEGLSKLVATMFGVTQEEVKAAYLRKLLHYRAAVFFLNLAPYIALKIMA